MNLQLIFLAAALCVTSAATINDENHLKELEVLSKSSDQFSAALYKEISKDNKNKNLICSTLSAHVVLSMTAYGARTLSSTAREMMQSLKLPANKTVTLLGYQSLIENFDKTENAEINLANKIFVEKTGEIKDNYKELTKKYFKSEIGTFDANDPDISVKVINDWVDEGTHHMIKDMFNKDEVNKNTRMILLNAIYFKGDWSHPFKDDGIFSFHVNNKESVITPVMVLNKNLTYGKIDELKVQFVELPYKDHDLKMVIVIPDEIEGLSHIEESFDYTKATKYAIKQKVYLSLPKFKIESSINLNNHLQKLGMANIFTGEADFHNLSDENLFVGNVKQKAFIEVSENGTVAAAATGVRLDDRFGIDASFELQVDRPFYFFIRKSDVTLFQGHVYNPML